jgi:hypothetical protein
MQPCPACPAVLPAASTRPPSNRSERPRCGCSPRGARPRRRDPQGRPRRRGDQHRWYPARHAGLPCTPVGYRALLAWARILGVVLRARVEGTSSYGAALSRMLRTEGLAVIEVNGPAGGPASPRQDRCHQRRSCHQRRAVLQGHRRRQDQRRPPRDGPNVQAREVFGGQVPHTGDQPAQGRACRRRPRLARAAVRIEHATARARLHRPGGHRACRLPA